MTVSAPSLGTVVHDEVVAARAPWLHTVKAGQTLRIVDLEGNQAVDFLAYSAADDAERYSAQDTPPPQGTRARPRAPAPLTNAAARRRRVTATAVAYPATIGGACSCESNTLRYGHHTKAQHACVENFLTANARHGRGKRDMVSNVNWFMNVPVEADGALGIVDGISAPGLYVDLRAEMDVVVVVSNCPQINNPCNGFNPTPVRMIVSE